MHSLDLSLLGSKLAVHNIYVCRDQPGQKMEIGVLWQDGRMSDMYSYQNLELGSQRIMDQSLAKVKSSSSQIFAKY